MLGGRESLAALVSIRDDRGRGPETPWQLSFLNSEGDELVVETYDDRSDGSFIAFWWPDIPAAPGEYRITATVGEEQAELPFQVAVPTLGEPSDARFDRSSLSYRWTPVPDARSYVCRLTQGQVRLTTTAPSPEPACAFGSLTDGLYGASVLAFSADLSALSGERDGIPAMPPSFEITEVRYGFSLSGDAGFQLRAAGGAMNYGSITPGFAFAVDVSAISGAASTVPWTFDVTGPAFSSGESLRTTMAPGARKAVFWSYDHRARPGDYAVYARSDAGTVTAEFAVASADALPVPVGVLVQSSSSGSAEITWEPVTGANGYLASVWETGAVSPHAELWVNSSPASFPAQTFIGGTRYDVYVAATNVDVLGLKPLPDVVLVSENSYSPASFTAP